MATMTEMKEFVNANVQSDLAYLWNEKALDIQYQYRLAQRRITTLDRFAAIEEDREKLKELMIAACRLPRDVPIEMAVTLADLVTCWSAARSMTKAELEQKATAAAAPSTTPPFVPTRTYNLMAAAFKEQHGRKPDAELPGNLLSQRNCRWSSKKTPGHIHSLRSRPWRTAWTK